MKTISAHSIPNGTKFVAFYQDGSGCEMYEITNDGDLKDLYGEIIGNAPDHDLRLMGFTEWMPILKTFKFWYERKDGFLVFKKIKLQDI